MNNKDLRELRRNQVELCLSSGLSIAEWCRLNHIASSTLFYWIGKFRDEEPDGFGASAKSQTSNWIELSKEEIALKRAIVPLSNPNPVSLPLEPARQEPIRAHVNGIDIAIPTGTSQEDIACVFQAVLAL